MWGDVTCAGDGVEEDGEPGLHDTLTPLHSAFPGARIRPAADGQGYVVKLLGDCGPVTLPDNMGAFTLELNGFSITGSVTYVYAENGSLLTANSYYDYQAAFTFEPGVGDGVGATAVNVVGPGEIRGPDGAQALDLDKDAEDGQPAVRVPDDCQTVSLTLGDGVTVRGGNGPCAVPDRSYALPEGTCLLKLESAGFKQLSGANKGKILLCASEAGKVSYGICTVI